MSVRRFSIRRPSETPSLTARSLRYRASDGSILSSPNLSLPFMGERRSTEAIIYQRTLPCGVSTPGAHSRFAPNCFGAGGGNNSGAATPITMRRASTAAVIEEEELQKMDPVRSSSTRESLASSAQFDSNVEEVSSIDPDQSFFRSMFCPCIPSGGGRSGSSSGNCRRETSRNQGNQGGSVLPGVTYEQALEWRRSFESLMNNETGRAVFHEFLRNEYSEENLLFWVACEEYKKGATADINVSALGIYEDFVSILSPREISIDSAIREKIESDLPHPTIDMFTPAQMHVYVLMSRDSFPRFINSPHFMEYLTGLQQRK